MIGVINLIANMPIQGETLAPLTSAAPQTYEELWAGYDPEKEPLDVEVLKEWEEDGVVLRVIRYRVGVFKGKKAMMAGVYGFPKGAEGVPGLLNIHGGGQYADYQSVLTNAKRGYATITIAWAGRISAPDYRVSPNEMKLFWEKQKDAPNYRVTTDWGALDAYHAPSRNGKDAFVSIPGAQDWTLDSVESPRNSSWFLCTMGARRALTFLQKQPEVNPEKLGVYGHSMGGKLTVATSGADSRVKAAAPSCGGISDRYNDKVLHRNTVGDSPSLKRISCPTIFLKPANDFHAHINDLVAATEELGENDWRVTCSAHLNHRDYPESEVATQLWFDQHLKGEFKWPDTPQVNLKLKTQSGTPQFTVKPDDSRPYETVEVFYTQQGIEGGSRELRLNRINRFWHYAKPNKKADGWGAELPVYDPLKPLWVYANVSYRLDEPVSGAGYYYGNYAADRFNLSSLIHLVKPGELQDAGVKAKLTKSPLIEDFEGDWRKQWFSHNINDWSMRTHKVYHPLWRALDGSKLSIEMKAELPNKLVIGIDDYAAEIAIQQPNQWQTVILSPEDLINPDQSKLASWEAIKELRLLAAEHQRSKKNKQAKPILLGGTWKGSPPEFRNLRWVPE